MTWQTFQTLALPLLKLYRDDYIRLHEIYFEEMNINEPVVEDTIDQLCEKPDKACLDARPKDACKDEYDQLIDISEHSTSFDQANKASPKV